LDVCFSKAKLLAFISGHVLAPAPDSSYPSGLKNQDTLESGRPFEIVLARSIAHNVMREPTVCALWQELSLAFNSPSARTKNTKRQNITTMATTLM
jgi:hypothetical protein